MTNITKSDLIAVLKRWGSDEYSSDQLQEWMIDHYDPPEVSVGKGEPEHTQEAMHIVMNEYEICATEKYRREGCQLAIEYIQAPLNSSESARKVFIKQGFTD